MVWTIVASTELISLGTNATLQGRALSRIAQVTLLSNQITEPTCNPIPPIPPVPPTPPVSSGGGGSWAWSEGKIDACPDGDYSYSYYDDICGTAPTAVSSSGSVVSVSLPIPISIPLAQPIISITKVPSRLTPFKFGGGDVTYTYTVRNPGIVAIKNVVITDDKCAPVFGPIGDINKNKILETTEIWKYTCDTNILVSTRNTATVKGNANGFTATANASASVIVLTPVSSSISTPKVEPKVIPGLPNTWITQEKSGIPWNIIILVNIILFTVILVARKRSI